MAAVYKKTADTSIYGLTPIGLRRNTKKIKLEVQEDKVTDFLTQAIGNDIILLVLREDQEKSKK